ncbi:hypothetical protein ADEAN_000553100 [Angomonas deanei]|uniref:Uncharacterized protein n=1 Tax=Angomonas deanei TaxID=59799 RepID=A0A7G2CFD4_9TRYP|nr:hypothetical protein ADEAN_000553100 [Angomonas deanei]
MQKGEARPLADYVAQLSSLYALIDCLSFREESSIQGLREVSRLIVAFVQYKKIQLHSSVTTAYVDHVYLFLHQSYTNNGVDGLRASMEFINTTPVVANTLTQIVKQTFFIWWLTPLVRSDTEELRFHWDADLRRAALDEICFSTGPQNNSLWEAPSVDRSALLVAVVSTMTDADLHEYLRALEPSRRQSLLAKLEKYIAEAEKNVSVLEAMKEFLETLQEDDSKTQQEREEELAQRTREKADALLKEQERLLQEKKGL